MSYRLLGTGIWGKSFEFSGVTSLTCLRSYDTPAHWLEAEIALTEPLEELCEITLKLGEETVFSGLCDQQIFSRSSRGSFLTLRGRSLGARLVDNEAQPQTYRQVTLQQLFDKHIRPYGFPWFAGDGKAVVGDMRVYQGSSEWDTFSQACRAAAGKAPLLCGEQVVLGRPARWKEHLLGEEVPVLESRYTIRRDKVISSVALRDADGSYSQVVENRSKNNKGIQRKRYLTPYGEWASAPLRCGEREIRKAELFKEQVTLTIPAGELIQVGDRVVCRDGEWPSRLDTVLEVRDRLSSQGAQTGIVLGDPHYLWEEN